MVVLNLRGDCLARTATNFQQGMTDKRFLELEIRAWLHSPARKRQLAAEAYYDGAQDVLHRRRVALDDDGHIKVLDHLPNNRLVNNIYAKMVDQKTNYSFGRPFSFDTEDKGYAKALNSVLGPKFRRVMRNVGEGAWIGGKCWLFPYYEGGELAFKRFPADEVLPFWADADHTVLDAAVHVYAVLEYDEAEVAKDVVKAEVMHGGGVDCFILRDDGTLEPDPEARSGPYITAPDPETGEETGYNWERIPLVCFKSSQHEIPLLSKVKCLQDAYVYSGKTATAVLRMIAEDFQLNVGSLEDTGYVIGSRVEDNHTLFDIIQNALDETLKATSQMYVLYDDVGKLTLKNIGSMKLGLLIDEETAGDFDYKSSIASQTYDKVKLCYENQDTGQREIFVAQDSANINQWGVLQYYEKLDSTTNAKAMADALLGLYNTKTRTLKLKDVLGDCRVRAGTLLVVMLGLGDINLSNYLMVEQVKHSFSNEQHLMDLNMRGGTFVT